MKGFFYPTASMLTGYDYNHNSAASVKCPVCRYDYAHAYRRVLESPPRPDPLYETLLGVTTRQGAIGIRFEGECGHEWVLVIANHKGQVYTQVVVLKDGVE